MLAYEDFAPRKLSDAGLLRPAEFERLEQAVAAANAWVAARGVEVVSVETVVLPNVWAPHARGTGDPNLGTRGDFPALWNQFVRVWYKK